MGKSIFMIFQVFGIVAAWSEKALADGKITIVEAVELATKLAVLLGIPNSIDMSTVLPDDTADTSAEGVRETLDEVPKPVIKPGA